MPRNLDTRVELLDADPRRVAARASSLDTLDRCFADNTNAGSWTPTATGRGGTPGDQEPRNVQRELMAAHAALAAEASAASAET